MPMKIDHLALWCRDLEGMKKFYEKYFNARSNDRYRNDDKGFSSYFLSFGDKARLEIMHSSSLDESTDNQDLNRPGYAHLAFSTGSEAQVDALTKRLIESGYACIDGPRWTGDGYYESVILDPEGNKIELTV